MKFVISILFFTNIAFSQSNEILGLSRTNTHNRAVYLAKVNETSGLIQDIASNSYSENISNFTYTVDPVNNIFYYTSSYSLIGINMSTGQLVTDVPMSTSLQSHFQNFIYNEVTQELIGLERGSNGGNQVFLSKINTQTGVVTAISQNSITDVISLNGFSTIDLNNQWFQFVSNGQLLSVDISTGQVVHSPTIDTSQIGNFDNIRFNAFDGQLYGLGRSLNEIFLSTIDPVTGNVTLISQQSVSTAFTLSGATINPFTGIYYFQGRNSSGVYEFIGVDINSGDIISATSFDSSQTSGGIFEYYYFSGAVSVLLSNQNFDINNSIQIFPNPVENILSIKADDLRQIKIFKANGKQVSKMNTSDDNQQNIDVSALESGLYFLELSLKGQTIVRKIIKR